MRRYTKRLVPFSHDVPDFYGDATALDFIETVTVVEAIMCCAVCQHRWWAEVGVQGVHACPVDGSLEVFEVSA